MLGSARRRSRGWSRAFAGVALLGAAGLAPLQAVTPGATAPATAARYDACGVVLPKGDGTSWTCSFVDEFSGRGLDSDKWVMQSTEWTGYRTGLTCYKPSSNNIVVRKGTLQLIARDEGAPFACSSPFGAFTTRYTGGTVGTRDRFAQTYGRFEVRAKYPTARNTGVHGAFWLYPQRHTYGAWPASGEIDVAEWWSVRPDLVMPTLHYPGDDFFADSGWQCTVADATAYHTYAVEWTPSLMTFFIDGTPCFQRSWTPDSPLVAPQPFDHPFNLVLTMGVGEEGGTNPVTSATELPAVYTVDYAKAWR